jgi:RNA polymerase sigma factor (sigma-70 family)
MSTFFEEKKDDLTLVNLTKDGDNNSLKELIDRHSGICINIYKKYTNIPGISGYISDEIASSKDYIIYNSAKTFDPSKGSKFSTWLANQTRFYCLNSINKNSKIFTIENEILSSIIDQNESQYRDSNEAEENIKHSIDLIKDTLAKLSNKKIKKCIEYKYFSKDGSYKTFTQVAKEMNVTVQTAINWHNKFINLIKNKINKEKI